jgi:hypothetical protein
MKHLPLYHLLVMCAFLLLSSCDHEEPVIPIKPLEERTVLVLTHDGEIYDQNGKLVKQLPDCDFASEIISEGDDYFVSGSHAKRRVGYWKNGKWNTLHVDFIDDVDHWTYGLGKWDYNIYLLDLPNVLKNSGIFPLEDCENFVPDDHALAVSRGKCYVIGFEKCEDNPDEHHLPVLYTDYKKEYLPMPADAVTGECQALYAYDRDHILVGGIIDGLPVVWINKQYQIYDVLYPRTEIEEGYILGCIESITMAGGHVYAAGFDIDYEGHQVATLWIDGVPQHYLSGGDCSSSHAIEIHSYGDDVYMLTSEYYIYEDDSRYDTQLWLNGNLIRTYKDVQAAGLTVL